VIAVSEARQTEAPIPVVETSDLSKRFGAVQALEGVTISLPPGCTGLLGPNGAGKSTLIKLLLGLLTPDRGSARVQGYDTAREPLRVRAIVGYMPEHDCLPSDALAQDFVRTMGEIHGLPHTVAIARASDALYHVGLGEERYRAIGGFSTGMKQRVKLAQALVHDPHLLLLDEPTNGLDPAGRDEMLALIDRISHEMGINVILTSHLLADIERVADTVVTLHDGKVAVQGSMYALTSATPTIVVRIHGDPESLAAVLRRTGESASIAEGEVRVEYRADETFDSIRDAADATGSGIIYLKQRVLSLEDVYLASQATGSLAVSDQEAG
jgi:ABC-2 type transport system ATP-binding protein